ncbi:MAG: cysteine hydrolase family protein [candidate division Zixibacteria bacterium]|nr:cysteine hydrolase family protein [candidate division Zixibacteria bacterium]
MSARVLHLSARYYRALPTDHPGWESVTFELPLNRTAFVGMHCWNIGCPDGPAVDYGYCVGMGWPEAAAESYRIMKETIRPAMDAARSAGMTVCHVETDWMDARYPHIPSRRNKPSTGTPHPLQQAMLDRAHGPEYLKRSPLAGMKRAAVVSPVDDEPLLFYSDTLDDYLKKRNIDTLIYAGFAADMCVLNAEGGARPMLGRGYRCILMRDATVGVETPQSFPERLATRYGIHIFEWSLGFSTTFAEYMTALERLS